MSRRTGRKSEDPPRNPRKGPLPLLSSAQIISALRRLGFVDGPVKGSSHNSMWRPRPSGGKDVTTVVLGKKQVPRGTLKGILKLGNVTNAEFMEAIGRRLA